MKRIFALVLLGISALPLVSRACDGGGAGYDLPPPVAPTPIESLVGSVSNNAGLFIGLAIGTIIGAAVARQRKLLPGKAARPLENPLA
ncbi:MAG: hypothetical protein M3032_09690 [Verrucomicrobiota bacterium]|nr:hypothetical protein [Verrucomicrobiota bacterium]